MQPASLPPLPSDDLDHVIEGTRSLWAEVRGKSFFVTGGTGFFGMWLLESFARANDELDLDMRLTVLTREPSAFARKAPHLAERSDITFCEGDVRSFTFPAGRYHYVVHAATDTSRMAAESPEDLLSVILDGTRRVLDFARQCGVEKFLLTSSGAVYGRQPSDLTHVTEDFTGAPDPLKIESAYGLGKRAAEHMAIVAGRQHGFAVKVARCFAFVGPHLSLDAHFAIGNFIRDAMAGGPIRVNGDGTPFRSYLYAADLAVWLWTLLLRGESGRAYNVGSGQAISIRDLAEMVRDVVAPNCAVMVSGPTSSAPAQRYVPNVRRASSELGLHCEIGLRDAIARTADWHRSRVNETQAARCDTGISTRLCAGGSNSSDR